MSSYIEKLKDNFDEMVVYKDLKKTNFFSTLSLPAFMRDWLLKRFEDESGEYDKDEMLQFVKEYIPRKTDWNSIKNKIITENRTVRFLAKIGIQINVATGVVSFNLPEFSVGFNETIIEPYVWDVCKDDLLKAQETWGMVELGYRQPDSHDIETSYGHTSSKSKFAKDGKIKLLSFTNFCPYDIDTEQYKEARETFTVEEWIDVLLGAVDYNAGGYTSEEEKLTLLTRLLPFVEKRLNLVELAPKGTGKSYLYGNVSKFGWLASGGRMSRAKMFYDISTKREGLISSSDFVVLDEVQAITLQNVDEMDSALQGYMENGSFTVGNYRGTADAGIVISGNIDKAIMDTDGRSNMFADLPDIFHRSALVDRFHGFIKGWNIPRMNDDLKVSGWALNSEYFCSILHELRDDMSYRQIVDDLIIVPDKADTRDTEAVKKISTAYLKLLFPNVRKAEDISGHDFRTYCLNRAIKMRETILYQLGLLDSEYRGKSMPDFMVREY